MNIPPGHPTRTPAARPPLTTLLSAAAAAALILGGCATGPQGEDPAQGESDQLQIVTSTNVYADIAAAIGGDLVAVKPIITSTSQDPHSYEATAQDRLLISKADLVIYNGGGYDSFMEILLDANSSEISTINAVDVSGLAPTPGEGEESASHGVEPHHSHEFNEHIWYDLHAIAEVAEETATALAEADPQNSAQYRAGSSEFTAELSALSSRIAEIAAQGGHPSVAITETVPLYLLESVGAQNLTPVEFSQAVEEGFDVAPAVVQEMLTLVKSGEVDIVAHNPQTASPETERVRQQAEESGVTVMEFTETIPEGHTYLTWMAENIATLETAIITEG